MSGETDHRGATIAMAVLNVAFLGTTAWLPERCWERACRWRARQEVQRLVRPASHQLVIPAEVLGDRDDFTLRQLRRASVLVERLPALRMYRPGGWPISVTVDGLGHIREALAAGKGAVLWVPDFRYSTLVAKVAMHRAGVAVHHVSRPGHGFGESPFERTRLNPIRTRVEDRYLASRIRMPANATTGAMKTALRLLRQNEVVSITVGDRAHQVVRVPFFEGTLALATGPLSLAASTGAPIFPLVSVREPGGRFRVTVRSSLPLPGRDTDSFQQAGRAMAEVIERACLGYRGQWFGWKTGAYSEGPPIIAPTAERS